MNKYFEVLVIENNTISLNSSGLAYWTEVFPTHTEAKQYAVEVTQQENKFNSHYDEPKSFFTILVFECDYEVSPTRIVEVKK